MRAFPDVAESRAWKRGRDRHVVLISHARDHGDPRCRPDGPCRARAGGNARGLELIDVTKRFGEIVALDGVSFEVRPGRVVGFLGPNGAGKTTAMRAIFGLLDADAGNVLWCGRAVGLTERMRFGYMPEERGLYIRGCTWTSSSPISARYTGSGASRRAPRRASGWSGWGLGDRAGAKVEEL